MIIEIRTAIKLYIFHNSEVWKLQMVVKSANEDISKFNGKIQLSLKIFTCSSERTCFKDDRLIILCSSILWPGFWKIQMKLCYDNVNKYIDSYIHLYIKQAMFEILSTHMHATTIQSI